MPKDEPWEYTLHIPHDARAVTVCRRTVRLILTMHGLIRLTDVAELLATELVTNAVRHTKGPAALCLHWRAGVLRIGAWDADPEPPPPLALAHALETVDPDSAAMFAELVESGLVDAQAKKIWKELMMPVNYFFKNPVAVKLREEGRVEDRIEMTLRILELRGLQVPDSVRLRVEACSDLDQLKAWSERAVHVANAADLFDGDGV
ncbi:hypothetical protein GCM10023080_006490 [Streptomyces pseudoechinosporeus]